MYIILNRNRTFPKKLKTYLFYYCLFEDFSHIFNKISVFWLVYTFIDMSPKQGLNQLYCDSGSKTLETLRSHAYTPRGHHGPFKKRYCSFERGKSTNIYVHSDMMIRGRDGHVENVGIYI